MTFRFSRAWPVSLAQALIIGAASLPGCGSHPAALSAMPASPTIPTTARAAQPASTTEPASQPPGPSAASEDAQELRMLALINKHRSENGAGPLRLHPLLAKSARWLSQDMAARSYLRHTDSLGRDSFERMESFGFGSGGWRGENIACGNGDADATYAQWLNSPGHDANMLNPRYALIGIARAYDATSKYGWYWTTDFGGEPAAGE